MSKKQAKNEIEAKIKMMKVGLIGLDLLPESEEFPFPVEIFPSVTSYGCTLNIKLPYNLDALRQYRKAMGRGWRMDGEWIETQFEDEASRHNSFFRPELSPDGKDFLNPFQVILAMHTSVKQSICHIEQVGVKEVPIWRVICE